MKVLIVDDEMLVRRSLRRAFEKAGHEVREAEDGAAGLDVWRSWEPDLVYLDVLMPKMSGPQVLRTLGDASRSKVVLMSAFTGEYDLKRAQSVGAQLFISKPFADIFSVVTQGEELVRV